MVEYENYSYCPQIFNEKFPSHWKITPMYGLVKEKKISNCTDLELLSVYLNIGVIPFSHKAEKRTNVTSIDLSKYQRVDPGDFVLNNQQAWRGSVGVSRYKGIVSPAYIVLEMDDCNNSEFMNYMLRSHTMVDQYVINSKSVGSIQRNIHWIGLKRTYVPIPPRVEQNQIVRFLDWKVSKINKLIAIKKRRIVDYKEYEKKEITEKALHGLDKGQSKYSGNRLVGEIPVSWNLIKLGKFCSFQNGISESGSFFTAGTPFVGYTDVYRHFELPRKVKGVAKSTEKQQKLFSVKKGDIFFTRTSENIEEIGMASICKHTIEKAIFSGFLIRCRPRIQILNEDYMKYYLQTTVVRNHFSSMMNIVIRASLGQNLLKQMPVLVPPLNVQEKIAEYLNSLHKRILHIISITEKEIYTLEELKNRLISDVVTGKIDVRSVTIPEYEHVDDIVDDDSDNDDEAAEAGEEEG